MSSKYSSRAGRRRKQRMTPYDRARLKGEGRLPEQQGKPKAEKEPRRRER